MVLLPVVHECLSYKGVSAELINTDLSTCKWYIKWQTSQAVALAEGVKAVETWPEGKLEYVAPSGTDAFWTSFKLAFALPWRRFKNESVLVIKVGSNSTKVQ